MMKISKILELSPEIFKANSEKGFWDEERNVGELLSLMNSEMYEALEADRKEKFAKVESYKFDLTHADRIALELGLKPLEKKDRNKFQVHTFKRCIKDSKEDELADFLIRIMDFWGSENWYLVDRVEDYLSIAKEQFDNSKGMAYLLLNKYSHNFPSFVYNVTRSMPLQENIEQRDANSLHDMCSIFYCVLKYCEQQNIDILFHIEEKLKYNATRPRKHGKKY